MSTHILLFEWLSAAFETKKQTPSSHTSKRDSSRKKRAMAQSTSLRKPTRSQEVNAKKGRRLAPFGMTGSMAYGSLRSE
jgi:hypothetical protein